MFTRTVRASNLPTIEATIAKLNRRAVKLGATPFTLTQGARTVVDVSPYNATYPTLVEMVEVTIHGDTLRVGDYSIQARIDIEPEGNIINAVGGVELAPRYRTIGPVCDHCNTDRNRKSVYVLSNGHNTKDVGRSCLRDFLGHDPERALWVSEAYYTLSETIDNLGTGGASNLVYVSDIMAAACTVIRLWGFVSAKNSRETGNTPSSVFVSNFLFSTEGAAEYRKVRNADDATHAQTVIDWVISSFSTKETLSDYEYNSLNLIQRDAVDVRRIGILVSLVAAYNRAHAAPETRVNAWIGNVGEKREFTATLANIYSYESMYGVGYIATFNTPEGTIVYKGSSPFWSNEAKTGDTMRISATIKHHDAYKGHCQTVIQRAKLMTGDEKPTKTRKAKV